MTESPHSLTHSEDGDLLPLPGRRRRRRWEAAAAAAAGTGGDGGVCSGPRLLPLPGWRWPIAAAAAAVGTRGHGGYRVL